MPLPCGKHYDFAATDANTKHFLPVEACLNPTILNTELFAKLEFTTYEENFMKVQVRRNVKAMPVEITTEFIKLESFLKLANAVESGGMAKNVIQDGEVFVNDEICTMRGKKLRPGDTVRFDGEVYLVADAAQ